MLNQYVFFTVLVIRVHVLIFWFLSGQLKAITVAIQVMVTIMAEMSQTEKTTMVHFFPPSLYFDSFPNFTSKGASISCDSQNDLYNF